MPTDRHCHIPSPPQPPLYYYMIMKFVFITSFHVITALTGPAIRGFPSPKTMRCWGADDSQAMTTNEYAPWIVTAGMSMLWILTWCSFSRITVRPKVGLKITHSAWKKTHFPDDILVQKARNRLGVKSRRHSTWIHSFLILCVVWTVRIQMAVFRFHIFLHLHPGFCQDISHCFLLFTPFIPLFIRGYVCVIIVLSKHSFSNHPPHSSAHLCILKPDKSHPKPWYQKNATS